MIYRKTWTGTKKRGIWTHTYKFSGLFLFGLIPLFVDREYVCRT